MKMPMKKAIAKYILGPIEYSLYTKQLLLDHKNALWKQIMLELFSMINMYSVIWHYKQSGNQTLQFTRSDKILSKPKCYIVDKTTETQDLENLGTIIHGTPFPESGPINSK